MKILFLILLLVHGLIHLMGFTKAFQLAELSQLTKEISKPAGAFWLLTAILFLGAFALMLLRSETWWICAGIGVICSQVLIILSWTDAKYGTILNVIVIVPVLISFMSALPSSFQNRYRAEVRDRLSVTHQSSLVTESDIQHLPVPVQKYLRYTGAVGKPMVFNFRALNHGAMRRSLQSDWMDIKAQQYNFYDDRARLFYIEMTMFGLPLNALHAYIGPSATMRIEAASVVQIVDARGEKMNQSETVTMFNDMCCLAPPTLIDSAIRWEAVDSLTAKASFTNQGHTIAAVLSFNENGELVNFISNDRFLSGDGKTYLSYPWSTPVREYKEFNGRKVATYGEAIWHMPEGEFPYAKFNLSEIEYNCSVLKWNTE
jgi:hypothetical protein